MELVKDILYILSFSITLFCFGWKFTKVAVDLTAVIQKLNDNLDGVQKENAIQNTRIEKHGQAIDNLNGRVDKLEVKVDMYHKN